MGGISQNPITRYSFSGVDTVPTQSRVIDGTATWDGKNLSVKDYDADEIRSLKRYDGLLINGELAVVDAPARNTSSETITIPIMASTPYSGTFADKQMKVANGLGNSDYMREWHILGSNYEIDGQTYTTPQNFKCKIGLQLVTAGSQVTIGAGHVSAYGNASGGGGGGGGGQTPAGAMTVVSLGNDDSATVASYATISVHIVGEEATFNGQDISAILAQSGAFVFNDDINSVTAVAITTGRNTTATIIYRAQVS